MGSGSRGTSNAMKPGIHGVGTHWIRGFMAFPGAGSSAGEMECVYGMMWEKGGIWGLGVI